MAYCCYDFVEWLGPDMSLNVLLRLDDPADLVRFGAVSHSLRYFVTENEICKKLCTKMYPELLSLAHVLKSSNSTPEEVGSSNSFGMKSLETGHQIYCRLAQDLRSVTAKTNCISNAICASSTDHFPFESIENTLFVDDRVGGRPRYWSSKGESDPQIPETMTYKLRSNLCIIDEINIWPFQAFFQFDNPIYSAKAVRFKMGCSKLPVHEMSNLPMKNTKGQRCDNDDDYVWTYISPRFSMVQESQLQTFKLPRPVLCIGGILCIELLGRVQKQATDGLFYICVHYVQVVGRRLSPAFDVEVPAALGACVLKYCAEADTECSRSPPSENEESTGPHRVNWHEIVIRLRAGGHQRATDVVWNGADLRNALLGMVNLGDLDDGDDDEEELELV